MMRASLACLMLSACATTAPLSPPERLAGCWINREIEATSMRWLPDAQRPGVLNGTRNNFARIGQGRTARYTLEPSEQGWSLCELDASGAASRCWIVAQGEGGVLEGGRAFIDRHGDRLRISVIGDGQAQTIFAGRRDGCD